METVCKKRYILFSGNNKKNIINLSASELVLRVVKVKNTIQFYCETAKEPISFRVFVYKSQ